MAKRRKKCKVCGTPTKGKGKFCPECQGKRTQEYGNGKDDAK